MTLRVMEPADIPAGLRLCRAAGWNQLADDWRVFLKADPAGARVAIDREGTVVGTVATLPYEDRFTWISMVLVDPAARGRGIGTRLLQAAIELVRDGVTARLDATPSGEPIYRQHAFETEYQLTRLQREPGPPPPRQRGDDGASPRACRVRPMLDEDLAIVFRIDRDVFGADRGDLLTSMRMRTPGYAWIAERADGVEGYVFGRDGFRFEHVGPIVAGDPQTARALVTACVGRSVDRPWIVDAPDDQADWQGWLQSIGFSVQRPFARMFRSAHRSPGDPAKIFAIVGPEFG